MVIRPITKRTLKDDPVSEWGVDWEATYDVVDEAAAVEDALDRLSAATTKKMMEAGQQTITTLLCQLELMGSCNPERAAFSFHIGDGGSIGEVAIVDVIRLWFGDSATCELTNQQLRACLNDIVAVVDDSLARRIMPSFAVSVDTKYLAKSFAEMRGRGRWRT